MRVVALLAIVIAVASPATARAQSSPPSRTPASDVRSARFEAAVAEAKTAMMANPEQALAAADVAERRARELPPSPQAERALATAGWLKGEALMYLNQLDRARPIVETAIARAERHAPNSKLLGDLMRSRGAIAATSNAVDALRDFQRAYEIFRAAKEIRSQAIALQEIGQIYSNAGDFSRTLEYYSQANELYSADPGFRLSSFNNRAEVLRELKRYDEAERDFNEALKSARALGSPLLEARILSNLAGAQVEHRRFEDAQKSLDEALRLSRSGEAAGWRPIVLGSVAKLRAANGDWSTAASLLRQAFANVDFDTTDASYREFHELAARVFERTGDVANALRHLRAFQRLESESSKLTASAASQLVAARFDFQNQKQKILERDARIKEQQAQFRTRLLLGLTGAVAIVLILVLISALRIRKSRNQVRAANVVLNETNTALEKALRAKTEFLAMTSHEIRTPLNGILGMTQILLTKRTLDSETREQVQVVHGAGEAMRALVDDILDVAKMQTDDTAVADEEVPFRRLLEDAARLWSGHAAAKDIALDLDIDGAPPVIRSDEARLRQIVGNLLSNAVKFTNAGTVTLRACAEEERSTLVVEVSDTGIGIPEDQLERVFEAFHQVDGGTSRQFSGTGLGLAICRNLANALGGELTLRSVLGQGSTVTLRIPLHVVADSLTVAPGGNVRPPSLAQARLLLVESNPMTEGVMRSILEPATAAVDCAADGAAAISAIRLRTSDHVLVEARSGAIDGLSGIAALRAISEACKAVNVPMTVLVAPSDDHPLQEVATVDATNIVLKPVGAKQLLGALQAVYDIPNEATLRVDAA